MTIKKTLTRITVLGMLLALLMVTACRDWRSQLYVISCDSVVVVRCKYEREDIPHSDTYRVKCRVVEIWRDESNGLFPYGAGDVIEKIGKTDFFSYFPRSDPAPMPEGVVLFLGRNDDGLCRNIAVFINNDRKGDHIVGMGSVERVKNFIMTINSSGEKIEIPIHPVNRGKD